MKKPINSIRVGGALLAGLLTMTGCVTTPKGPPTLKDTYKNDFLMGVAINTSEAFNIATNDDEVVVSQFNALSPENDMKWALIHPRRDGYAFSNADQYVAFGESNHMFLVGHTLVWHSQVPAWVFRGTNNKALRATNAADRDFLLQRMHDHIQTVVGRYKGRIKVWDVVNEALDEYGALRPSPWRNILGEDFIAKAFQYAHEADPNAILRYNDYNLEKETKLFGDPTFMTTNEITDWPKFVGRLVGHADPVSAFLWQQLSDKDQASLTAFDQSSGSLTNVQAVVDDMLNRLTFEGSPRIVSTNITDWPTFANQLTQHSDPVSAFLWEKLTNTLQASLSSYNPATNNSSLNVNIARAINRIIDQPYPSIYDAQRFQGVSLRPETINLMKENPIGTNLVRLNRLLLEDAYPTLFTKNQVPSIYDSKRFHGISLRQDTKELLKQHTSGPKLARLNRLLLEDAYPMEVEKNPRGAVALLKRLQAEGVPVMAVGMQGHMNMTFPEVAQEDTAVAALAKLGLQVMVTELDVDMSAGGPTTADVSANQGFGGGGGRRGGRGAATLTPELQQKLADRYSDFFGVFLKYKKNIKLVTFWGVNDLVSWRAQGNPLLFDRKNQPKPAFDAVINAKPAK